MAIASEVGQTDKNSEIRYKSNAKLKRARCQHYVLGVFGVVRMGAWVPRHAAFLPAALAMDKLRDPLF